jgi:hypothetical protein
MSKQRIDGALERFRAAEQNLYTEEGQKLYSDEEHELTYPMPPISRSRRSLAYSLEKANSPSTKR